MDVALSTQAREDRAEDTCGRDSQGQNVGQGERIASMLGGAGLIAVGVSRRNWLLPLAGAALLYRGWTGQCSVYRALSIDTTGECQDARGVKAQQGRRVDVSMHIEKSKDELYSYWRDFANLPKTMKHLISVTPLDEKRSHWIARGPLGRQFEWDAEIVTDRPHELISWQSLPGSEIDSAGSVTFEAGPQGEGTDLSIELKYDPPGGAIAGTLVEFLGQGFETAVREDLRALKQMLEAGETATAARDCAGHREEIAQ